MLGNIFLVFILSLLLSLSFCEIRNILNSIEKRFSDKLPIFDFGDLLGKAIDSTSFDDEGKVGILFTSYLNRLRDFYLEEFISHSRNTDITKALALKNFIVKECQAAMRAAIPKNYLNYSNFLSWEIGGPLQELVDDIDKLLEGIQDNTSTTVSMSNLINL